MSTPTVAGLLVDVTAVTVSTTTMVIVVVILVVVPILYWILRALTGRLGR